ncbi:MAG: glycosyltransferase [Chloroflexota bacterium]
MITILSTLYVITVAWIAVYGLLGLLTLALYWRHRNDQFPLPSVADEDLPSVTVQLPIYNERFVVERLIKTAVSLDYPRDRLQIQVVDDSTDDTTEKAAVCVQTYQAQGINIELVRRQDRSGYKAGALGNALPSTTGDFVAVFDADFQPQPQFLRQTVPHFIHEPQLGMIQARWGHTNHQDSPLTAAQAIALDKHFAMEQTVRHRANLFPKFNGAAGIWRKACIEAVGGWQDDTVCEDLCLSTRAILEGWQFRFLNDVVAPAELPSTITAYKNQQARWAKGSVQCLRKFGWDILTDKNHPLVARLYAVLAMSAYATHILLLILLLLQVPLLLLNHHFSPRMLIFSVAGIGQPILFILAQQVLYSDWRKRLKHFPTMLFVAIGIAPSTSRAILQAFFGTDHPFIRTPKGRIGQANRHYYLGFDRIVWLELFMLAYAVLGLGLAIWRQNIGPLFLLMSSCLGFGYAFYLSLREADWTNF